MCFFPKMNKNLKNRQRNTRRCSQTKENVVESFVRGKKNKVYAVCFQEKTTFGCPTICFRHDFQKVVVSDSSPRFCIV